MRAKLDLTGERFGKLTVLQEAPQRGVNRYWFCKCDCGSPIKEVRQSHLRNGAIKSCGCSLTEPKNIHDFTNKRFGRLVAIKPTDQRKQGKIIWLCKCDCGNTINVPSTYLTTGETESCGCLKKELESKYLREKYDEKRVNGVAMQLFDNKPRKTNTTGYRGVQRYYTKKGEERFKAYITVKGKRYSKSGFETAKEAYYNGRLELEMTHLPDRKDEENE